MKASYSKRCGCRSPDGKHLGARCPDLTKRRHGTWGFATRLDTTTQDNRQLKRFGFPSQAKAAEAYDHIRDMVKLAGDDGRARRRIADLIFSAKRGAPLPSIEEMRRKIRIGADVTGEPGTVAELLEDWYRAKKTKKISTRRSWRQHMDHYLIPILGEIRRDRLRASDIDGMFDRIAEWNEEIADARAAGRVPHLPDDRRTRHGVVGIATQHRIHATLRAAYNWALKRREYGLEYNPALAVELPPEKRDPARVWSPEQVARFLAAAEADPLHLLFRLVLLRGLRRGEACGLRRTDRDPKHRRLKIAQTVLQLGGKIIFDTPKSEASNRMVSLDATSDRLLAAHLQAQRRHRLASGPAYEDHGLIFAREDGCPLSPDWVSARFKELAARAGLPVIKLHEARHTAATLALEAELDVKVVAEQLGHSTTRITQDLYEHVRQAVQDQAAERIVALLGEDRGERDAHA